ncbi:MAG: radical SAM protein [Elusimicrobiota bacterium]
MKTQQGNASFKKQYRPSYLRISLSDLKQVRDRLMAYMEHCELCPRKCGVNRLKDEHGVCRSGRNAAVSSYNVHTGEEPPVSGVKGSGTVFFTNCNLHCVFCQNYPISQMGNGKKVTSDELAKYMVELQGRGVHNINLVTPTHVTAQMVEALVLAREKGLRVPLVYNTSGYDSVKVIKLLENIVDVYLPDIKYTDNVLAGKYSGVNNYVENNKLVLKEMYRQVGDSLKLDSSGNVMRGMIVRHLVLPGNQGNSEAALKFIAEELSPKMYISLMAQYHPAYKAEAYTELQRRLTQEEYDSILSVADELLLENGWRQEL